ncbi:unnamed protein product [Phytophthora fragariaefolia]|uniref:Unnamed protein product n=1 Tax=Phytophthora fragariaefolia TaxID=1490495 RepID=A0A9W7CKK7_9STRA|nr:unnamed protein product [Phytophthora fragariaefolia]
MHGNSARVAPLEVSPASLASEIIAARAALVVADPIAIRTTAAPPVTEIAVVPLVSHAAPSPLLVLTVSQWGRLLPLLSHRSVATLVGAITAASFVTLIVSGDIFAAPRSRPASTLSMRCSIRFIVAMICRRVAARIVPSLAVTEERLLVSAAAATALGGSRSAEAGTGGTASSAAVAVVVFNVRSVEGERVTVPPDAVLVFALVSS